MNILWIMLVVPVTFALQSPVQTRVSKPITRQFDFYGDISPIGFFDPLQITANCDENMLQYMREAEIHHGRIAMTAAVLLPVLDYVHPETTAVRLLSESGNGINEVALMSMGFFELARMTSLYKPPREALFELKDDVQPGQLNPYIRLDIDQATKELSNGRLAMIGVLGFMVQEFVSNTKIFYG